MAVSYQPGTDESDDIWQLALAQRQEPPTDLQLQVRQPDIWDQALNERDTEGRIPEVSLQPSAARAELPIVTEFLPEGQPPPAIPEVSLPPIERPPTAFPAPELPPAAPERSYRIPAEAAPEYQPTLEIPGIGEPEGPPIVEPPWETPPIKRPSTGGARVDELIDAAAYQFVQRAIAQAKPIVEGAAAGTQVRFGGAPAGGLVQPLPGETYGGTMQRLQESQDPLLAAARAAPEFAAREFPVSEEMARTLPVKVAGAAGEFAPVIATGVLAPAVIGMQTIGHEVESGYKEALAKGLPPEKAARETFDKAIKAGATAEGVWFVLPSPMKKVFDRYMIDKVGATGFKRFVAGRAAKAGEGYALGATSQATQNLATGRPITQGVHEAGIGLATANLLFPGGPTAREVAAKVGDPSKPLDLSKPENFAYVDRVVPVHAGERGGIPIGKFGKLTSVDSSGERHTGEFDPNLRVEPGLIDMREVEEDAPGMLREKPYKVPPSLGEIGLDPKTVKGEKKGFKTYIMYLTAATGAGIRDIHGKLVDLCKFRTENCTAGCLGLDGMGSMDSVRSARANKTKFFYYDEEKFLQKMDKELTREKAKARAAGYNFAVRLNGTSDVLWEKSSITGKSIMELHPDVQFYDYTKYPMQVRKNLPPNYHITYSYTGLPGSEAFSRAWNEHNGTNTAVVFADGMPAEFLGRPVIDGDATDLRFLDPKGVIVGLHTKGKLLQYIAAEAWRTEDGQIFTKDPPAGAEKGFIDSQRRFYTPEQAWEKGVQAGQFDPEKHKGVVTPAPFIQYTEPADVAIPFLHPVPKSQLIRKAGRAAMDAVAANDPRYPRLIEAIDTIPKKRTAAQKAALKRNPKATDYLSQIYYEAGQAAYRQFKSDPRNAPGADDLKWKLGDPDLDLNKPGAGSLAERAKRIQPPSEAGSIGGRGGEERPEEREEVGRFGQPVSSFVSNTPEAWTGENLGETPRIALKLKDGTIAICEGIEDHALLYDRLENKWGITPKDVESVGFVQGSKYVENLSPASEEIVPKAQLFLEFGQERHPVESIADASARFSRASDAAILRQGTEGVPVQNRIVDSKGNVIGRISPNGKVWDKDNNLIYDPRAPGGAERPEKPAPEVTDKKLLNALRKEFPTSEQSFGEATGILQQVAGLRAGTDGYWAVIPPHTEAYPEGTTFDATGPFATKAEAQAFIDAEVGAHEVRIVEVRGGKPISNPFRAPGATLAGRARRIQPPSEAGSIGGRGGEERPEGGEPGELRPRAFGQRLQEDQRLLQDLRENLGNLEYEPVSNKLTAEQAADFVNARPVSDVIKAVKDETNGLQYHVRSAVGQLTIQRLNRAAAGLKAVDAKGYRAVLGVATDLAEWQMEYGTQLGKGVQSFAMWNKLTPEGKLMSVTRLVKKVQDEFKKRKRDEIDRIKQGAEESANPEDKINQLVTKQQDKIARQLSDTPTWARSNPTRKNEILELIRAHLKKPQTDFLGKMGRFGVQRTLSESIDRMAAENRRRIAAISTTKDMQKRAKEFDATADRLAQQLSDTPSFRASGRAQLDPARQLIREHLKAPQPDFVKRLVGFGADEATARTLDRLAIENRERILKLDRAKRAEELRRAYTPRNSVAKRLQKEQWEKLVELADHGLLTDRSFMDTAADRLGLPRLTPEKQARILELGAKISEAAEGMPSHEARKEFAQFVAKQTGYGLSDIPSGVYYGNMLSGYNTQLVNMIDTLFNVVAEVNGLALANPRSATQIWANTLKGFGSGTADFLLALTKGRQLTNTKWLDSPKLMEAARFGEKGGVPPIRPGTAAGRAMHYLAETPPAKILNLVKYVGRLMSASDSIMYRAAKEAKAALIADRMAREEGLRGAELDRRVKEIMGRTPEAEAKWRAQAAAEGFTGAAQTARVSELRDQSRTVEANADADDFAGNATYNHDPRGILGHFSTGIDRIFSDIPLAKAVLVPFTRIVANVTNRGLNYTPWGFKRAMFGYYGDEGTPKGDERAALVARATMGSMGLVGLAAAQQAGLVNIHGAGPSDPDRRRQLVEAKWKPYTIQIGNNYYSYVYTPIGLGLAALGNFTDAYRYKELEKKSAFIRTTYVLARMPATVFSQSFLSSLSNVFAALTGGPGESVAYWRRILSGTVGTATTPRIVNDMYRIFDPNVYDSDTIQGDLLKNTPFSAMVNRPALNAFGEPVKLPSNRFISVGTKDLAWQTVVKGDLHVPVPDKGTTMPDGKGGDRQITQAEYYELLRKSGPYLRKWIVTSSPLIYRMKEKGPAYQAAVQQELDNFAGQVRQPILMQMRYQALRHPTP